MDKVWPALDVLAQCSQAEGMPYSLLEAMGRSIPVVASAVPGHMDLVVHEHTGLLYSFGDRDALARSIVRLLRDPRLRERIGSAGRRQVLDDYSVHRQVDALLALYECTCAGAVVRSGMAPITESAAAILRPRPQ